MVHLQCVASRSRSPAESIITVGRGLKFVFLFTVTVGSESVESHTGNVTTFVLSALFEKQESTFAIVAESVGRIASTDNSVLYK